MGKNPSSLMLGDIIAYGGMLDQVLRQASRRTTAATVFSYRVRHQERFGVAEMDASGRALRLEEKPKQPRSNQAVTGLCFYDERVVDFADALKLSVHGELEFTDLNRVYLERRDLHVEALGRSYAQLDTGTHDSLLEAGQFISTIEQWQGLKVARPEEIARRNTSGPL